MAWASLGPVRSQAEFALEWPVQCKVGETCIIQQYVDRDPGPDMHDYMCGSRTYDGHDGVDIRVPTSAQRAGVAVVAAAAGRVLRTRDGVPDQSLAQQEREHISGRECGNGVLLAHEAGFETQYCHMAQSSVAVKPGDTVQAGQVLGKIGLSGNTQFPHLHITVRREGRVIDPFADGLEPGSCGAGRSLWKAELAPALAYKASEILDAGFSGNLVTMEDIENGTTNAVLDVNTSVLVASVRAVGLQMGDVQQLIMWGPGGAVLAESRAKPLDRNKAEQMLFVGKRRPPSGWAQGTYLASYSVLRRGQITLEKTFRAYLHHR